MPRAATATILPERVSVLETKVEAINEKIDDLKVDVKAMHDCLDKTRDQLAEKLEVIQSEATSQHQMLEAKILDIERTKDKWQFLILGGLIVLGWVINHFGLLSNIIPK